jgi:hypothetical protein
MDLTQHARTRMQQRGINAAALGALLDFGRVARAGRGRDIVYFDKRARQRLARATALSPARAAADSSARAAVAPAKAGAQVCNTYAILESDGTVITVGHRTRRINR